MYSVASVMDAVAFFGSAVAREKPAWAATEKAAAVSPAARRIPKPLLMLLDSMGLDLVAPLKL